MDSHTEPVKKKKKMSKKKLELLLPKRVEREVGGKQLQSTLDRWLFLEHMVYQRLSVVITDLHLHPRNSRDS